MNNNLKVAIITDDLSLFDKIQCCYSEANITFLNAENGCEKLWSDFDGAMFVESADITFNSKVNDWVGHPHLRYIKNTDNKFDIVCGEIDVLLNNIELEKKLLIEYPDIDKLAKYPVCKCHIEQTYLICNNGSHRIRKRICKDTVAYFETLKIRIDDSKCIEHEGIISEEEFNLLMQNKNPDKNTIIKDRYNFLYDGQYFELDVYPFWQEEAVIELELRDENQHFTLPPEIKLIKDVSEDYTYKNNYLAGLKL